MIVDPDDIQLHAINAHCGVIGVRLTRDGRTDHELINLSGMIMKEIRDALREKQKSDNVK